MGSGWGVILEEEGDGQWSRTLDAWWKPLLFGQSRPITWTFAVSLARPVTPEVAGSSPVAPVKIPANW
jgi:hypothetical protein